MARFYEQVLGLWARLGRRWRIGVVAGFALLLAGSAVGGLPAVELHAARQHLLHDVPPDARPVPAVHAERPRQARVPQLPPGVAARRSCTSSTRWSWTAPTEITKHAFVPNAVCGRCHIEGDSTRWKIIANTAGHRKHLESRNPRLRNVTCVTCHGVSLHVFAAGGPDVRAGGLSPRPHDQDGRDGLARDPLHHLPQLPGRRAQPRGGLAGAAAHPGGAAVLQLPRDAAAHPQPRHLARPAPRHLRDVPRPAHADRAPGT